MRFLFFQSFGRWSCFRSFKLERSSGTEKCRLARRQDWFRDVDSNHDTQLQRLMSYRLDDPGTDSRSVAEPYKCAKTPPVHQFPISRNSLFFRANGLRLSVNDETVSRDNLVLVKRPCAPRRVCSLTPDARKCTWNQVIGNCLATMVARDVPDAEVSAKLIGLFPPKERCPSGLRSTLGKRV